MNFQNLAAFGIAGVSLAACIGWPGATIIEDTLGTSVTAGVSCGISSSRNRPGAR